MDTAVDKVVATGIGADGQVSVPRKATKSLVRVARMRGAKLIVIDETPETSLRRFVEGDVGAELAKKLRKDGVTVHVIPLADQNFPNR